MNKKSLIHNALAGVVALGVSISTTSLYAQVTEKPNMEKCYGVVKARMNDCGTPSHSCAGQATTDNDPNEWIYVAEGTCEKLVSGSKTPGSNGSMGTGTNGNGTMNGNGNGTPNGTMNQGTDQNGSMQ